MSTAAPESRPAHRRLDVQGLRAIAVGSVVAYHAGLPVPGGFVGVDIFFVISGYVITAMLAREWGRHGRIRFGQFYLRRFKRLTPALAVMVAVTVLVSAFVLSPLGPQQTAAQTGIGALLLVANAVIARTTGGYFDAPAETNALLHTWSLSVEEQFYLVFPALLALGWAAGRRIHGRRRGARRTATSTSVGGAPTPVGGVPAQAGVAAPVLVVSLVAVVSFAAAVAGSLGYQLPRGEWLLGFYSPVTRAWEFAVGALLALAASRLTLRGRVAGTGSGLVGLGLLAASFWMIDGHTPFPGVWALLPVAGTAALILAGTAPDNPVSALLSRRGMVTVGDWSYSIYLWHWPAIVIATVAAPQAGPTGPMVAAALSLLPAIGSYYLVEQPIRSRPLVPGWALARMVGAVVAPPMLLAGGAWVVADTYWTPQVAQVDSSVASAERAPAQSAPAQPDPDQQHAVYVRGCWYDEQSGAEDPPPCRWHSDASGRPVYLAGDSHAAALTEALVAATDRTHRPLTVTAASACPLVDVRITTPTRGGYDAACQQHTRRTLAWLARQPPGTVVLASTDNYWLNSQHGVRLADGQEATGTSGKLAAVRVALTREVRQLQAAGHDVVLVQSVPSFRGRYAWAPERCSLASTLRGCTQRMPVAAANTRSAPVRAMLATVGADTGARVADVSGALCPGGVCATRDASGALYADESHVTIAGSLRLAPAFAALLGR